MEKISTLDMMKLYDEQLRNAQKIQQKIIPATNSFNSSNFSFYSYLKPFRRVGGDFYDFKVFDDDSVSFLLADATGHGIDAAMLTGMVKLIYSYSLRDEELKKSPGKILQRVNDEIENLLGFTFFSSFSFFLDPNEQKIYWNNAGHPSGYLIRDGEVKSLSADLPLIGMHSMFTLDYKNNVDDFKPGDKLILFTDGLIEGKNTEGEQYDKERVKILVNEYNGSSIETLCSIIINDFKAFTIGADETDDVCLLGIQYD